MLKQTWQAIRAWVYIKTSSLRIDEIVWHRGQMILKLMPTGANKKVWLYHDNSQTSMIDLEHMKAHIDDYLDVQA